MSAPTKQSGLFPDMDSMDTTQITQGLERIYNQENHRIVFWYDPEKEFIDALDHLDLDDIKVVRMDKESALELKVRLELEDTQSRYLLYFTTTEPPMEEDWLLDIKLYSRTFHADRASILLNELGLESQTLRSHLTERKKFFNSKDRLGRLKKLVSPDDDEDKLDLKMLAVITRSDQPTAFDILRKLFGSMCDSGSCDLETLPKTWGAIVKYGLEPYFWELMSRTFGYTTVKPSLRDMLIRLLVSDLAKHLTSNLPTSLNHLQLQQPSLATNVSVFIAQWRGNLAEYKKYSLISRHVSDELKLTDQLSSYDENSLIDTMTFEAVERQIIRALRDQIAAENLDQAEELKSVIFRRRDGHWANITLEGHEHNIYQTIYLALESAIELLVLRQRFKSGFSYPNAKAMYSAYTSDLFRFDQYYRLFHEAADQVELEGWDILRSLEKVIEDCYSGWFMDQLSVAWGGFVEDGLLETWKLDGVENQQNFYSHYVYPKLTATHKSRVFVVISDAFRFEAAEELTREINGKNRFKAELGNQLSVLPSYTALGMASLLPHFRLEFNESTSVDVMVDGASTATIEGRNQLLEQNDKFSGAAIKMDTLMAMSRDQARGWLKGKRLVYIYHNKIDSTGDSASSEKDTFHAVRAGIEELNKLTSHILNNLNGNNVIITADHGFVFQNISPSDLEKSTIKVKPTGTLKAKKRYLLGKNLGASQKTWHGKTNITAGAVDDMEFWIPKGANRFHFSGGARFIHGGALPQEVVVPIITVREMKGKDAGKADVKKVGVSLLGSSKKIVNNIQRFELIQTEKVSDKRLPVTLSISLRDGEDLISNEEIITFDSTSDSMDDRKRSIRLMLKEGNYEKTKEYFLVLRHHETQIEHERIPFVIDLAFAKDF